MALRKTIRNGWAYLGNILPDSDYEEALAPTDGYHRLGRHHVGIQCLYQNPVLVRAFCDLSNLSGMRNLRLDHFAYVGYVRFLEIELMGQPILPSVFGGAYKDHAPYARNPRNAWFVDFMGLGDARARQPTTESVLPPMYAFNSMLWTDASTIKQLSQLDPRVTQGGSNGMLYQPQPDSMTDEDDTVCVSLRGQINTSLTTPDIVEYYLRKARVLVNCFVANDVIASKPLYQLAIEALREPPAVGVPGSEITLEDISYGRFVGRYLLLNVANSESMEPVLCVQLTPNLTGPGRWLTVHLIDYDTASEMERSGVLDLLTRVREQGMYRSVETEKTRATGRGSGDGLVIPAKEGRPLVTFHVRDCVFGMRKGARLRRSPLLHFISGIEYELPFLFDDDSGGLVLGEPGGFGPVDRNDSRMAGALAQYESAYRDVSQHVLVDTSNFDMIGAPWLAPGVGAPTLPQRKQPID